MKGRNPASGMGGRGGGGGVNCFCKRCCWWDGVGVGVGGGRRRESFL